MADPVQSETLLELLVRWEDQRRQGRTPTPEELCPDDPSLREVLRQRIARRERMQAALQLPDDTLHYATVPAATVPVIEGYTIHETVGRGGMGVVYRATQQALQRTVALKMILSGANASPDERTRFRTEAEAVARLQHPNIVQIYEVGERGGCPYVALEYVAGGSLAQLTAGKPLPPRRAAQLVLDLARAVEHAHSQGVIHRDLKPANVLLTPDGTPKIADFGLAKRLDAEISHTQTGAVFGSPSYMAPEQAEGKPRLIGTATDVYALGAILYELLTGRPPFLGASFLETLEQVRHHDPAPPQTLQPTVPQDLALICLKCLEKKPAQRYPSAEALAQDLQQFLQGEPISARRATWLDQMARLLRHSHIDVNFGAWSTIALCVAPVPFMLQLAVYLFLRDRPGYPLIALGASMATVLLVLYLVLFHKRASYALVPAVQRRQVFSTWCGHAIGFLLVPLLIARMVRPETTEEWFVVYAIWLVQVGGTFFTLAPSAGFLYLTGCACFLLALLIPWIPEFAPLLVGTLMSVNMTIHGLFLRRLAKQAAEG
jgi:serine/threonine protein kinase